MWFWPWFRLINPGIALRSAMMADAARMAAIHAEGFAMGWDRGEIERMLLADHIADALVSEAIFGKIVTGFAISRVVLDEAELLSIALDREVRGKGFSKTLLTRHATRLRQAGATSLFLEVAADNAPALALYRGLGMAEIGRRKGYYPATGGTRRDALTMRWDLTPFDPTPRFF
jgi:[ribosomal protein S18]-alanine N-acetyltransferase